MQDTISRVLPQWQTNHQGYSHLMSLQAFAVQERGDFAAAESLAHRSMSMNNEDGSAFHALLHALESQGKHQDGASMVQRHRDAWSEYAVLKAHLTVHWMYFLIETGRFDRVVALLKNDVLVPDEVLSANGLVDVTQVYWRLRFAGFDVPFVLEELDRQWTAVVKDAETVPLSPLAALHAHSVFSLLRPESDTPQISDQAFACDVQALHAAWVGQGLSIDRIVQFSHRLPGNGEGHVVATLLDAISAYAKGQFHVAVDKLLSVRGHLHVVGGTRVEAEFFELLLVDAARASSQLDLAKLLLIERLNIKPHSAQYWKTYGDIMEDLQDEAGVDGARRMSYVLGKNSSKNLVLTRCICRIGSSGNECSIKALNRRLWIGFRARIHLNRQKIRKN
ncbi:hypothetical protein, variant 14 [Aphanomyces astaci]|nr:hypothetical protein, variant 14 [Aphanomyces astaci]ETV76081.1 hypothetical protein, variant 14 [Aphanomyces astaci]|eukprot:XP_009834196.1 hypothetical protein, variant 14 [Aphanomyces astaci]